MPISSPIILPSVTSTYPFRIVFFGTPEFSATILETLVCSGFSVVAAVTQPDKPVGRKYTVEPCPVKKTALRHAIPTLQPERLKTEFSNSLRLFHPDILLTAAYGKIFPSSILEMPPLGCLNVHASLLPAYRGASPIQEALRHGDAVTGITLMRMEKGLDTGPVYARRELPLEPNDLYPEVSEKLARIAADLVIKTLPDIFAHKIIPVPQKEIGVSVCATIQKEDGLIAWDAPATAIFNTYRAFFLWPGIHTFWKRGDRPERLKLLRIQLSETKDDSRSVGEVYRSGSAVCVQTSKGSIQLITVQPEGKTPMSAEDFVRGCDPFVGSILSNRLNSRATSA